MVVIFILCAFSPALGEEASEPKLIKAISDNVTLSGLVELQGSVSEDFEGNDTSDVALSTGQIGLDAELEKWASGHLLFLYEEDGTDGIELDEGTVTLGGTEDTPLFFTAGKMYLPFGVYDSSMISDPMTLELAETNQSTIQLGAKKRWVVCFGIWIQL